MNNNDLKEKDIEMKRKAQKEYCAEKLPNFAEFGTDGKGNCLRCGKNIWEHISLEKTSNELITGCPICNRTYCD